MRTHTRDARRLAIAAVATAGMLATVVAGSFPAAADPDPGTDPAPASADEKFTDGAMTLLTDESKADFWVRFADRRP